MAFQDYKGAQQYPCETGSDPCQLIRHGRVVVHRSNQDCREGGLIGKVPVVRFVECHE